MSTSLPSKKPSSTRTTLSGHVDAETRLKALLEASTSLASEADAEQVLERILSLARATVAADAYAVWERVDGGAIWRTRMTDGLSPEYERELSQFASYPAPYEPILVQDVEALELYRPRLPVYRREGIRGFFSVPLILSGNVSGALTFYYRSVVQLSDEDVQFAVALASLAASVLHAARIKQAQERERHRLAVLAEASAVLSRSLDYQVAVNQLAEIAVRHVSDWCSVDILDASGALSRVAVASADPAKLSLAAELRARYPEELRDDRGAGLVMRTGEPEVRNRLSSEVLDAVAKDERHRELLHALGVVSVVTVPLRAQGRSFGVLRLVSSTQNSAFDQEDVAFAVELAARAAVAIENARLYRELEAKLREQQTGELALRTAHDRMAIAQDTARMGSWEYDIAAGRVHWSDGVERLHGMAPGAFEGSFASWVKSVHPEDLEMCMAAIQRSMETGEYDIEYRAMRVDGSMFWAVARGILQRAADGTPLHLIGVCMDVTSRKLAEDALRKTEKLAAAGRLAASISHEINNPLESVTNLLYLAHLAPELTAETRDWIVQAQHELARVSQIATLTLRFHRQSTKSAPTQLAGVLDSVLALHEGRIRYAGVDVQRDYDHAPPITVYESELRQVFANLVGNAADAMLESPRRRLRLRLRPGHDGSGRGGVHITVGDTGEGMNPETRRHLFEPFYSTKGLGGTGLGLWVSKGIVDKHSGHISVRSREGQGTVFRVFLPGPAPSDEETPRQQP